MDDLLIFRKCSAKSWVRRYSVVAQGIYPNLVERRSMERQKVNAFWNAFSLNSFEDVESKTFIVRLSVERVQSSAAQNFGHPRGFGLLAVIRRKPQRPTAPGKPPEAKRRSTGLRTAAKSRLQSFCSQKAPRWTPRGRMAGDSEAGREIDSLTWGTSKSSMGLNF